MTADDPLIIHQTEHWIRSFIIELNLCPFAKQEMDKKTVRFHCSTAQTTKNALVDLSSEVALLNNSPLIATSFLLFPSFLDNFFDYLDFVDLAEAHLSENGYEGIYQLATFHPHYCFANTAMQDVSNYSNRSPYPMLHLLREEQVEKAIAYYGNTDQIPENNIAALRQLGLTEVKKRLDNCYTIDETIKAK